MRPFRWHVRRDCGDAIARPRDFRAGVRTGDRVAGDAGNCRHAGVIGQHRVRQIAQRGPSRQWIDWRWERIKVPTQPARARRVRGIRGGPHVRALEMRAARILVPGPLNNRQPAVVKNRAEPDQARMQTEWFARTVCADLQHVTGRNRNRGPAAVIERIRVRNRRRECVVAAGEVQDHERPRRGAGCQREVREKRRRGKSHCKGFDAARHEFASCEFHGVQSSEQLVFG